MSICKKCERELTGAKKYCGNCGYKVMKTIDEKSIDIDKKIRIITDEPIDKGGDFIAYGNHISNLIANSLPQFTVGIYGGWGTGKTTLLKMIKKELDEKYTNPDDKLWIKTVWFDAWRYEKEKYSAMVPLLRSITLSLKNAKEEMTDYKRKNILGSLENKVTKILKAFARNTTLSLEMNMPGFKVEPNLDIDKIIDDYKYESFMHGQQRLYFYEHITDHLKEELQKIRPENNYNTDNKEKEVEEEDEEEDKIDFRLVIFVDDLDRCTPERSMEILESIKSFFDIEGIIYVVGIDPSVIDPIIQTKYSKESKINGLDYLQKIVQLPFQIPLWNTMDLSNLIKTMMSNAGIPEQDIDSILNKTNTELIIKTAQLNPRNVKRFVNSIMLARHIYKHNEKDIEKLIAVQAFYFHGNRWLEFLKLLNPYRNRVEFLKDFIIQKDQLEYGNLSLEEINKIIFKKNKENEDDKLDTSKNILNIYKKLVEIDSDDLVRYIDVAAKTLLQIGNIDKYLRFIESDFINTRQPLLIDRNSECIEYLINNKVEDFNKCIEHRTQIHIPYELFDSKHWNKINLRNGFLPFTNLSRTDLSNADLSRTDLSGARLIEAKLPGADLSIAKLPGADLHKAELKEVTSPKSNLSGANLSEAVLQNANLDGARLSDANLWSANLVGVSLKNANLDGATLVKTQLHKADLSGANLNGTLLIDIQEWDDIILNYADFKNSIIDNQDFVTYLQSHDNVKNIPNAVESKFELRRRLELSYLKKERIHYILNASILSD